MNKPTPAQCAALKMIGKSAQPTFTATIFSGSDVVGRINSKTLKALRQQGLIEVASAHEERIVPGSLTSYMPAEFRLTEQGKAYLAIRPGEQRERRILFFAAMRQPEMRLLRLALRHLDWDKGIDWRDIQFIHVEFYADDRCWMITTDKYLVVCFQAQNPALTYEDFSLIYLHQQDNPDCPCEFCVVERREVRHE